MVLRFWQGVIVVVGMLFRLTWLRKLLKRSIKDPQSLSLQKTTAKGFSVGDAAQRTQMKVGDFMTTQVVTVHSGSPVRDAARLMLERKISGLPVVDAGDRWNRGRARSAAPPD